MPTLQINTWLLKDTSTETMGLLEKAREILRASAEGILTGTWAGTALEDPHRFFNIVAWETPEPPPSGPVPLFANFRNMMDLIVRSSQDKDLRAPLVDFNNDYIPALAAPTTEILHLTLKKGFTKEQLYGIIKQIAAKVATDETLAKHKPATWGPTMQDANQFYLLIGWESMQVHEKYMKDPQFLSVLGQLPKLANLEMFHVNLKN